MKKNPYFFKRSRLFIFSMATLLVTQVKAQVSAYTFTTTNGTYAPITGTDLFGTGWNDNVSSPIPVGFNFQFNGTSYSSVTVNSNGFVTFGATPSSTVNYLPISTAEAYSGAISAFGRDLSNNGGATGISYTVTGTTPNKKCIIQWQNAKRVAGDAINFQIILNETSNQVDLMYGSCVTTSTVNANKLQVGLRGATTADFNNRSGGNNVAWTAFTAGTANTDNVNFKASVLPASGLTFSWKVTTCFPPTGIAVSGITSSTATFSWTSGASAFDLYYGPTPLTAPTATTVPTATTSSTSYAASALTSGSNYRLYVRTNCGAGDLSAWSAVTTFSTACGIANVPYTQNFQSATVPAIPACTSVENVGLGNIWQTQTGGSSFTTKVLYYSYSSSDPADTWYYLQALNLTGGVSYRLTYQYENSSAATYPERMNVSYGSAANAAAMTHTLTDHPNIVNDVANTQVVDFTPATTGVYYIGFHAYSMADEDQLYLDNITVDLSPTCFNPGSLTITGVGTTTASASWTPAGVATAWDLYYGPSPLTPPTAGTVPTATSSATSYTINGLTSGTNYDLYVRSYCSSTDQSVWTPLATFLTPCTPTVIPYSQDFQSVTIPSIPVCNSVENAGTGNVWKTVANPGSGFTSNTLVYNYNSLNSANTWFYIRGLNLTAGTSYRLTYRYGNNGSTTYPENLNVSYGTSPIAAAMTNTLTNHFNLTNSSPITKTVDFIPAANGVYYIGFHAYSDPDQNQLYVDDITVDLSPSCVEPTNLTAGTITATTAVVGWTPAGSETSWDLYYGPSPLTPPTAGSVPTATASITSYTATGLTPSMSYVFYVRAHCSAVDQSPWVGPNSFFTPCLPPNITSTTPSSRCGIGTTTLGATSTGSLNWYAAATGGSAIGTGSVFTTPVINTTTSYYVSSQSGPSTVAGGLLSPTPATSVSIMPLFEGLYFDVAQTCTLVSLDVYPDGASDDIEIDLYDNANNYLGAYTATIPGGTGTTAVTLPLNFTLPVGTGYHVEVYTSNGTSLIANSGGLTYPYNAGPVSLTSGFDGSSVDPGNYFYLYNFKVSSICEGPRVAVTATVTAPPALTITSGTTVCANVISTLNVTSPLSNFDSYVWAPTTNLYTNAGGTNAYTGGTATTVYYKSSAAGTTVYTVSANNSSNCANIATTTMVTDVPFISTSTTPSVACSGSTISLNAISIAATASVAPSGPASGFSDYTGGPYRSGAGSDYKAQWLFTAAELTSAGFATGNITSLAFNVTSLGGGVMPNYTIRIGNSASTGLTTTFDATPANLVFGPTPYTAVAGINTHSFSTPFYWDGVSNIVVQVCHDAVSVGSSSVDRESISNRTIYATTSGACGVTAGTSESYRPVIRFAGQVGTNVTASRNFVWNPGAIPTNTAVVSPVNAGSTPAYPVYTVAVTNPVTTCSNTAMVTLTINPIPTVLASASSPSLCSGTTASLTASGANTYSWMPAGGTSSVAVVSPAATTIYTVTGTALGCSSTQTVNLNVTPTPTVVASVSPGVICSGATVSLTATGATSYTWSPISVMSASTTATPTVNTTYSVTGSSLGCNNTKTVSVIVNNVPTLTITTNPASGILCGVGSAGILSATGTGTAYVWSNGPTTSTNVVTPTATTNYTVSATNTCGTSTAVATMSVGLTPTITATSSASLICKGNPVVLTASGTAGITYSWNTGTTTTSISVTPTTTTVYTVTGTNSCGTATAVVTQNVSPCTGVEEMFETTGVSIYPNPANDYVSIAIGNTLASNHTVVEVSDALGKLVMRETLVNNVTALSITKLEEGVYFFKVMTNNQTIKVGKVVKQ